MTRLAGGGEGEGGIPQVEALRGRAAKAAGGAMWIGVVSAALFELVTLSVSEKSRIHGALDLAVPSASAAFVGMFRYLAVALGTVAARDAWKRRRLRRLLAQARESYDAARSPKEKEAIEEQIIKIQRLLFDPEA